MKMLLLTITHTTRSVDLQVPAEVPLGTLLPTLVELCVQDRRIPIHSSQWSLWEPDKDFSLDPRRSLLESDIVDGTILHLRLPREQTRRPQQTFQPQTIQPDAESGGIGVRWNSLN